MHFMRQTFTKDTVKVKVKNVSKHETNLDEKLNTYFWWKSVKNTKKPLVHLHCTSNYHFEIFKKVCILNSNNFTTKPKIDNIFSSELDKSLFKNNSLKRCLFPSTTSSHDAL